MSYDLHLTVCVNLLIERRTNFLANNVHFCISVCDEPFSVWNIILITSGVIFFIMGVIIAIILVLLLLLRIKNSIGKFVHVCGHVVSLCVCS